MKIQKCPKCGKYIIKAEKCYHCQNSSGFETVKTTVVNGNALEEYPRLESLVETGKFKEAEALSFRIIEWMPEDPGVYWLRLLSRHECKTDEDLIRKGFEPSEDPDFQNAFKFSKDEEHIALADIQATIEKEKELFTKNIDAHEVNAKASTDIVSIDNSIDDKISFLRDKLFEKWTALEATEQKMYQYETDMWFLMDEQKTTLENSANAISSLKDYIYRLDACGEKEFQENRVMIGNSLSLCEQAKDEVENISKTHIWTKEYNDLKIVQDEQIEEIGNVLDELKKYNMSVSSTLSKIADIESKHKTVRDAVQKYDFSKVQDLLGQEKYISILEEASK